MGDRELGRIYLGAHVNDCDGLRYAVHDASMSRCAAGVSSRYVEPGCSAFSVCTIAWLLQVWRLT